MNERLAEQLALDYCCTSEDVRGRLSHFAEFRPLEGRRRYREQLPCYLKIAAVNGKLLVAGRPDIVAWCRERYADCGSAWFFEPDRLRELDERFRRDGFHIEMVHPFFLPAGRSEPRTEGLALRWFEGEEIERFRGDARFDEAFGFCAEAPDVLGVAALRDGQFLGMAGASADSPIMWQIGINVSPEERGRGLAKALVALLKNEILRRGVLPFYGTAMSHIASQRVAIGAGFVPAWAELVTAPLGD